MQLQLDGDRGNTLGEDGMVKAIALSWRPLAGFQRIFRLDGHGRRVGRF
jgi:hypothetical protein